jgi:predicted PurR-regulated permease PerM
MYKHSLQGFSLIRKILFDWHSLVMRQIIPSDVSADGKGRYSKNLSIALLIGGVVFGFILCYLMAVPFVPAIVWSITLAVLFTPLEARMSRIVRSRNLSAGLSVFIVAVVVVVPIFWVAGQLLNEVAGGAAKIDSVINAETWARFARENPSAVPIANKIGHWIDLQVFVQNIVTYLTSWSGDLVRGSINSLATILVTFYFLFYMLRDRSMVLLAVQESMPFSASEFSLLKSRVIDTIFASVYGTAIVSVLQGILGGLMFWWLDLPSPFFWAVLMGALAIVPFLGAFVIWVPVAIFLVLNGEINSAVILTLWGTVIIGLVDNIIYPVLVGNRLQLHSVPSFIAILGGLLLFGTSGIVLGPIIFVTAPILFRILRDRMNERAAETA